MAKSDARQRLEQIKRNKGKKAGGGGTTKKVGGRNVKDLRQLIAKKTKGVLKKSTRPTSQPATSRDLRDTNRKLAARKSTSQIRNARPTNKSVVASRPTSSVNKRSSSSGPQLKSKIQYYVPPHMQLQQQQQQPTYIIAPNPPSNLAMDNVAGAQGASVLVSNLVPTITQSEIIELFGEIGELTAVNMVNQTTALVSYLNSRDALKAVKVYNNRTLDDRHMYVNMMPSLTAQPSSVPSVRSRVGRSSTSGPQSLTLAYGTRRS